MFDRETLFILGAGASVPYGYPLGWELVEKIIVNMGDEILLPSTSTGRQDATGCFLFETYKSYFEKVATSFPSGPFYNRWKIPANTRLDCYGWGGVTPSSGNYYTQKKIEDFSEFRKFKEALQTFDSISIDTFLRDNPSHALAGKIMIVYSLLKSEDQKKFEIAQNKEERKEQDNWYRHLLNDMSSCSADEPKFLLQNKVSFITFNYDLSLDFYLYDKLHGHGIERYQNGEDSEFWNILKNDRIKHVYGQLYSSDDIKNYGKYWVKEVNGVDSFGVESLP